MGISLEVLSKHIIYSALFSCPPPPPSSPHGVGNANIQHEVWANSSHDNTEEYLMEIMHVMHVCCVGIIDSHSDSLELMKLQE